MFCLVIVVDDDDDVGTAGHVRTNNRGSPFAVETESKPNIDDSCRQFCCHYVAQTLSLSLSSFLSKIMKNILMLLQGGECDFVSPS